MTRLISFAVCTVLASQPLNAGDLKLPGVFADHMVIQRDRPIPVWGWADSGESITVELGGQTAKVMAGRHGRWMTRLGPLPAGGPHTLTVSGSNSLTVKDVLVGEVWMCSGQSNMAMTVSRCKDLEKEKALADLPKIRMFKTAANAQPKVQDDCKGTWMIASPDTIGGFSGTAWFFGRKLHKELGVPIGLINSSWGGTDIASWTSADAQAEHKTLAAKMKQYDEGGKDYSPEKAESDYQAALKRWQDRKDSGNKVGRKPRKAGDPMKNQNRPANLFNGMINPLIPYAIRGAIWYQGERNSKSIESGMLYADQLKILIGDWRARWGQGDFPFLTVQLPNFHAVQTDPVENTGWVMVRESELLSLTLKNTGLAVTTDVGMEKDIHPKDKQTVGLRLALWALGTTYDKDIVYSGPIRSSSQYIGGRPGKLGRVDVWFNHTGDGLKTSDGKPVRGFAVAGEDGVFHTAKAAVREDSRVSLTSKKVPEPVAARYNWADNPIGNLVNSAGLPASPFRTDTWEITPVGKSK